MTPDTPKPPAPAPASAETLEQRIQVLRTIVKDLRSDTQYPVASHRQADAIEWAITKLSYRPTTEDQTLDYNPVSADPY